MNKIPGWWLCLLLLASCASDGINTQDLNLAIHKCDKAGLRAALIYDTIQCRPHIKE